MQCVCTELSSSAYFCCSTCRRAHLRLNLELDADDADTIDVDAGGYDGDDDEGDGRVAAVSDMLQTTKHTHENSYCKAKNSHLHYTITSDLAIV